MKKRYGNEGSNDFQSRPESETVYGLGGYDRYELNLSRVFFGSDHIFYGGKSDDRYSVELNKARLSNLESGLIGDIHFDGGAGFDVFSFYEAPKWASPDYLRSLITTKNVEVIYINYGMVSGSLNGSATDDTMAARVGYLRSLDVKLGAGNDCYFGTAWGQMEVNGGNGDDLIGVFGAQGNVLPMLTGSGGKDVFQFYEQEPFDYNGATMTSLAKITDFTHGEDKIMVDIYELSFESVYSSDEAIKSFRYYDKYIDFHDGMLFINDRYVGRLVGVEKVGVNDFLFA